MKNISGKYSIFVILLMMFYYSSLSLLSAPADRIIFSVDNRYVQDSTYYVDVYATVSSGTYPWTVGPETIVLKFDTTALSAKDFNDSLLLNFDTDLLNNSYSAKQTFFTNELVAINISTLNASYTKNASFRIGTLRLKMVNGAKLDSLKFIEKEIDVYQDSISQLTYQGGDTAGFSYVNPEPRVVNMPWAPALLYPVDNSTGISIDTTLAWRTAKSAGLYDLQLAYDSSFSSILVNQASINDTSYNIANLTGLTHYYWRARGRNSDTVGEWSDTWQFSTLLPPPVLSSPSDSTENLSTSQTFTWSSVDSAQSYNILIVSESENTIVDSSGITNNYFYTENLETSTWHTWKVRSMTSTDTSAWSDLWAFSTGFAAPVLIYPADNAERIPLVETLKWRNVANADTFYCQVSRNIGFTDLVENQTNLLDTTLSISSLAYDSTYYWRVKAVASGGAQTSWSNIFSFTTVQAPDINGDSTICQYTTNSFYTSSNNTTNTWSVSNGTINGTVTADTVSVTWNNYGNGTLTLARTSSSWTQFSDSLTMNITIYEQPTPVIIGDTLLCENSSGISYSTTDNSGSGYTYSWTVVGGTITSTNNSSNITVDWDSSGTGLVIAQETNNECSTIDTLTVSLIAYPNPNIQGDIAVCENSMSNYSTADNSGNGNTYTWTVSGGTINSGNGTPSISVDWSSPANALVILEETFNGCSTLDTLDVTVYGYPTPSITGSDSLCEYSTAVLYNTSYVSGHSYTWTASGGTITTSADSNIISVDWGSSGTGKIEVAELNGDCISYDTLTVIINAYPAPSISGDDNVCENETNSNYTTTDNSGSGYTYNWSVIGGAISSGQNTASVIVDWGTNGSGWVIVEETNNNCSTIDSFAVTINAYPTPSITGSDSLCEYSTSENYSTTDNSGNGNTYSWTVTGGTIQSGQNTASISVDWGSYGTGWIIVEETFSDCSTTDSMQIVLHAYPTPDITGKDSLCEFSVGESYFTTDNSGSGNTYSWTVTGGTIQSGQSTSSITVDWGSSGSGLVILEESYMGCATLDSLDIVLHAYPTPAITGDTNVCEYSTGFSYSTTDHSSNGNTYNWTVIGGSIVSGQSTSTININWNAPGKAYVYVEENFMGCPTIDTLEVLINAYPTPTIAGKDTLCEYSSSENYSTNDNSISGNTYSWTVSGGTIQTGQGTATISVDWESNGNGQIILAETYNECISYDTLNIILHAYPEPSIAGDDNVCENETNSNYTTTDNSGSGYTYNWTVTGGTISSGQNTASIIVDWGSPGSGLVIVEETNNNCSTLDTFAVTINAYPEPSITGADSLCEYSSSENYYTTDNSGNGKSYSWTVTGGTIQSGQGTATISVDWGSYGTGWIIVEETFSDCSTIDSIQIVLHAYPTPSIAGKDSLCEFSVGESYFTTDNSGSGNTYSWTVTGGTIQSGQSTSSITVDWGSSGSGLVILEESFMGCSALDSLNIVLHAYPTPAITGDTNVCEYSTGFSYSTIDNSSNGNTYNWTVTGGTIQSGQSTSSITVNWNGPGKGYVYVEENFMGCPTIDTLEILINAYPTPNITGKDTLCEYSSSENYSTNDNSISGNTYSWTVSGGTIQTGQGTATISVDWESNGNGQIILAETYNECTSYDTLNIILHIYPAPSISGDNDVCENETNVNYTTTDNSGSGFTYNWTVTGGTISSGQNTTSINVDWGTNGSGWVIVEETNNNCTTIDSFAVTINAYPTPSIIGADSLCEYSTSENYSTTDNSGNGNTYSWTVTGGTIQSGQGNASITIDWETSGNGQIILAETFNECTTNDTLNIILHAYPDPSITGDNNVCGNDGNLHYSTTDNSANGNTYNWSVTSGTITSGQNTSSIIVDWETAGTSFVIVEETSNNCTTIDSFSVTINAYPTPSITGNDSLCENTLSEIYYTTDNSANGNTYTWTVSGGTIQSGQETDSISVDWGNAGFGFVALEEQFSECSSFDTLNVVLKSYPSPRVIGDSVICEYSTDKQYRTEDLISQGHSYTWQVEGGIILSGQHSSEITVDWDEAGIGYVIVWQSHLDCAKADTLKIIIHPLPQPELTGKDTVCESSTSAYSTPDFSSSGNTYSWTVTNGTISSGQNTPSINVDWGIDESGQVIVAEEYSDCIAYDTMTVKFIEYPEPEISGDSIVCEYDTQKSYTVTALEQSNNSYHWSIAGGTITDGQGTETITVSWGAAGTGLLVIEESNIECSTIDSFIVVKNPLPTPAITGMTEVCDFEENLTYNTDDNSATGNSYQWTITGGTIISGANTSNVTVNWASSGMGNLIVNETSSGCTGSDTIDVMINKSPQPVISGSNDVCQGDANVSYSTNNNNSSNYNWTVIGGSLTGGQNTNSITVDWMTPGEGSIIIEEINSGCIGYDTISVIVHLLPEKPEITLDTNRLISSADEGNQWFFNDFEISGATDKIYNASQDGIYTVQVTDEWGCVSAMSEPFNFVYVYIEEYGLEEHNIKVFPNPTSDKLMISINCKEGESFNIALLTITGKQLFKKQLSAHAQGLQYTINTSDFASGLYSLQIEKGGRIYIVQVTIIH